GGSLAGHRVAFDRWVLDPDRRTLTDTDGTEVALTTAEFRLLTVFLERPRIVLIRDQLLDLTSGRAAQVAAVLPMQDGLGVDETAIFTEAFVSLPFELGPDAEEDVSMTFAKTGKTVIARRGEGVIRVAEANGIAMEYSCRNGECGSCRCEPLGSICRTRFR
ncbi:MAG: 2Fe-2S iron-sulfur cluster binding domain-containing protein, partial [Candidatus Saccharibacteria bacterium]|nr:2Fe-2S iron-sulfur cluster binding domain-containing protein [Pseudorhodobacter sp.]